MHQIGLPPFIIVLAFGFQSGNSGLGFEDQLAELGNSNAQVMIAAAHERSSLPAEEAEAVKWYRLASDQGHSHGLYMLGRYYANGRGGLPEDRVTSYMLLTMAVRKGNKHAAQDLSMIEQKMTPAEIAEGKKRVSEFNRTMPQADMRKLESGIP